MRACCSNCSLNSAPRVGVAEHKVAVTLEAGALEVTISSAETVGHRVDLPRPDLGDANWPRVKSASERPPPLGPAGTTPFHRPSGEPGGTGTLAASGRNPRRRGPTGLPGLRALALTRLTLLRRQSRAQTTEQHPARDLEARTQQVLHDGLVEIRRRRRIEIGFAFALYPGATKPQGLSA